MSFRLSPEIELPTNAATSTFAFLGTRGSGKTYGAGVLVEEFLAARVQVVVVDPVGVWWALRLAADGVGRGFDIPVFGGIHGDIPLEPTAGELVAHLVVEQRVSLVLDVSDFTDGQQRRFVEAFSRTFFQLKKRNKSPTHLVFEEAHEFFPQVVDGASAPMVGATKRLWKVGRNYGIGGSLISTRTAEINKNALNITDRIITGRTTAPEDVKRIKDWASANGVNATQVAYLTSMPKGNLIVWRDLSEGGALMTAFHKKTTFDASRTPEAGDTQPALGLPSVDLGAIQIAMAATIEKAEANDPKALRARIKDLEGRLAVASPRIADEKLLQAAARERDEAHDALAAVTWRHNAMMRAIKQALETMGELQEPAGRRLQLGRDRAPAKSWSADPADLARPIPNDEPEPMMLPPAGVSVIHVGHAGPPTDDGGLFWDNTNKSLRGPSSVAPKQSFNLRVDQPTTEPPKGWTMEEESLYQKFKARLLKEAPGLLQVMTTAPELEVVVTRETLQIDGKSLRGRVAKLVARGFLDAGKKNGEVTNELSRTGPSAHPSNVLKELHVLLAGGFVHRTEGDRWIVAPGAKVRISE